MQLLLSCSFAAQPVKMACCHVFVSCVAVLFLFFRMDDLWLLPFIIFLFSFFLLSYLQGAEYHLCTRASVALDRSADIEVGRNRATRGAQYAASSVNSKITVLVLCPSIQPNGRDQTIPLCRITSRPLNIPLTQARDSGNHIYICTVGSACRDLYSRPGLRVVALQ